MSKEIMPEMRLSSGESLLKSKIREWRGSDEVYASELVCKFIILNLDRLDPITLSSLPASQLAARNSWRPRIFSLSSVLSAFNNI